MDHDPGSRTLPATFAFALSLLACGGSPHREPGSCDGPCPVSKIDHLVVVIQENHTFDNYFGKYCTAAAGSAPSCTDGPALLRGRSRHRADGRFTERAR